MWTDLPGSLQKRTEFRRLLGRCNRLPGAKKEAQRPRVFSGAVIASSTSFPARQLPGLALKRWSSILRRPREFVRFRFPLGFSRNRSYSRPRAKLLLVGRQHSRTTDVGATVRDVLDIVLGQVERILASGQWRQVSNRPRYTSG